MITPTRGLPVAVALAALVLVLTGCSSSSSSPSVTLAQTKASAQLMRNTLSGQISPDITASVSKISDASETCDSDRYGMMRVWRSTAMTELTPENSDKVVSIQKTIAGSLVSKGWKSVSTKVSDSSVLVTLTKPGSVAKIQITSTTGSGTSGSTIYVDVAGDCVKTEGPGSDELKQLGE